ncbi:MAG: hypothetical protein Q4A01_02670 [Coriobacteriales bacterium]|nr:hypothetical protein [Coriobacteriales bacterium]
MNFDSDVHGTVLEAIVSDLHATAEYLLTDRKDGDSEKRSKTVLHATAARDMLNELLDDIEDEANGVKII